VSAQTLTIRLKRHAWTVHLQRPVNARMHFPTVFEAEGPIAGIVVKRVELGPGDVPYRELEVAARFLDKPFRHLVRTFDYGHDPASEMDFVVFERVPDMLWEYLDARKKLPQAEALDIVAQILGGLMEMDGLVHCDLKPENILGAGGAWKIADFGRVRFREELSPRATLNKDVSYFFAPPELWTREGASETSDIYSCGGLLYRLLSGHPPFIGERDEVRTQHFYGAPEPIPGVPDPLNSLIARMMAKDPARRPKKDAVLAELGRDPSALVGARALAI
jgi:eukaryotic-like serine/threonine-protein kinase